LSVVILIRVVGIGIILVIALLAIPAAISKQFTHNMKTMMVTSTIIAMVLTVAGLFLSYALDLASGATIVLVLGTAFFVSSSLKSRF
jgi:ABC 3 transport family.